MIAKLGFMVAACSLLFGSAFASADMCEISGKVARAGYYANFAYFRLKNDPKVYIFTNTTVDVASRMAVVHSAFVTGGTLCFEGAVRVSDSFMQTNIPQVATSFNVSSMDEVVTPKAAGFSVNSDDGSNTRVPQNVKRK